MSSPRQELAPEFAEGAAFVGFRGASVQIGVQQQKQAFAKRCFKHLLRRAVWTGFLPTPMLMTCLAIPKVASAADTSQLQTVPIYSSSHSQGHGDPADPRPTEAQGIENVASPSKASDLAKTSLQQQPNFRKTADGKKYQQACPTIFLQGFKKLKLSAMENRLLCGDKHDDQVGAPWRDIPPDQAAFFVRSFLQSRGYHEPVLIQDGELLFVNPGVQSRLTSFDVVGGPEGWEPFRKRLIKGRPLTPKLLDELQGWALNQIKNEGYPCATVVGEADPTTGPERGADGELNGGRTRAVLKTGKPKKILAIETTGGGALNSAALDRYNAFEIGDLYRDYLIELTRRRTTDDGFLQSIILSSRCEPDGVVIVRDVLLGTSREVRAALGANTGEGIIARLTLKQNRIGSSASLAQTQFDTSFLRPAIDGKVPLDTQTSKTLYRWYYTKGESRLYLEPSITFDHIADLKADTRDITAALMNGYGKEFSTGSWVYTVGPTWLDTYLERGVGAGHSAVFYIDSHANWKSHDFEYFNTSPRSGEYLNLSGLYTLDNVGAHFTAQRLAAQGEKLWNIFKYDPPLLVLGVRFNINSVFSVGENQAGLLPKQFVTFAGGDNDLRGFNEDELPRGAIGALSAALGSFEARLGRVIFSEADVFAFNDFGSLGASNFKLAQPFFMSPGFGTRWESPIGVVRFYLAEGFALNEDPTQPSYGHRFRVGFTYGQEF